MSESPYIGIFTDDKIQSVINRVAEGLAPGRTRLVFHTGIGEETYLSAVKNLGDHISVESAFILDTSQGFKFDKEHMKLGFQIVGEW